jgi:acyl-CoA thioester hydrolase
MTENASSFDQKLHIRWSDLDPIGHVRHSVYYDFAAQLRTELFISRGITVQSMAKAGFGPILFEEKAIFKKELNFGDDLLMKGFLIYLKEDYSRFGFSHEIWRNEVLCAIVEVKGAFLDLKARKLTVPPQDFIDKLSNLPRHPEFKWLPTE